MLDQGKIHETIAADFLSAQGFKLLQRNFNCRLGEIDLILTNTAQQLLVFAEVRFRSGNNYGNALESITYAKQKKLIKAAKYYLLRNNWAANMFCRFDIIAISPKIDDNTAHNIEWFQDAISVGY